MSVLKRAFKRLLRHTSYVMILFCSLLSVFDQNWFQNLVLVFFITLLSTTRVSHLMTHWLLLPLMLCLNKVGSKSWEIWSLKWVPVFKVLFILASTLYLFDLKFFWFVLFFLFIEEFSNYVLAPKGLFAINLQRVFFNSRIKIVVFYGLMCLSACIVFLIFIRSLFVQFNIQWELRVFQVFVVIYILLLLFNWVLTFRLFLISQFIVKDWKSVILPNFINWKLLFVCFILFGSTSETGFGNVYLSALFGSLVVCEYLIEMITVYHESSKSFYSQLKSSPTIEQDFWLYYFLIFLSIFFEKLLIVFLFIIVVFAVEYRKLLDLIDSSFDLEIGAPIKGYWISNFNNDVYDLDVYRRIQNKFKLNRFPLAITFRWFYFQKNQFLSLNRIVGNSDFAIINLVISDIGVERHVDSYNYFQVKELLITCVQRPFFLLVVLEANTFNREYLKALDGRIMDSWTLREEINEYFKNGCREFYEVAFLFEFLDETPFVSRDYLEEISLDTLRLNEEMRELVQGLGMDVGNLYSKGLTPLLVLHRRTHEFSMVASRFMELLNLNEVAARWIMILERSRLINLDEEIQFSFGSVVSEIRSTSFAEVVLFENAVELNLYKNVLQNTFGYNQKENVRFRVIDFMNWVVFIRNKTRGHGSPSRVSLELYQLLEVNTIRLLQAIAEYFDPELLMCSSDFYVLQRGMNFDFIYYDEQPLPEGVSREINKPYLRHKNSNGWYTSNELMISKNNIYLLSAVKKGKCEWVCYNTGELIRPDVIFN